MTPPARQPPILAYRPVMAAMVLCFVLWGGSHVYFGYSLARSSEMAALALSRLERPCPEPESEPYTPVPREDAVPGVTLPDFLE